MKVLVIFISQAGRSGNLGEQWTCKLEDKDVAHMWVSTEVSDYSQAF